ncbi:LysR family transcriptional regulator [Halomonas sp. YLGW01]|uniref:LysR family transcriptional regulator n=1 Tax=Halomonas sp. YLGW01 TaxID=2773308 RepID=UPI0017851649|nr:LysR family transcriptional regulator [Halomonas sp. YLGW01]
MDHRQLAFLAALARERHFGRAAAACHVTQPTLSARLRQLEEELGTRLIRRSRRFEGFTPEGERVLEHGRRILDEYAALRGELSTEAPLAGCLTLGVIPTALGEVIGRLGALRQSHPRLSIRLRELATPDLAQGLANGALDLVVGYLDTPAMAGFVCRPLIEEAPALVAAPAHFSLPEPLDWSHLSAYPLCLLTPEMHNRQLLESRLAERGLAIEPVFEANSLHALGELLVAGHGVGVMPEAAARRLAPGLVARRLPGPGDRVGLLWSRQRPTSRLLDAVLAVWPAG